MKLENVVTLVPKDKSVDEIVADFLNRKNEVIFIHSSIAAKVDTESSMDTPQLFLTPVLWKDWYLLQHVFVNGKVINFSVDSEDISFFKVEE